MRIYLYAFALVLAVFLFAFIVALIPHDALLILATVFLFGLGALVYLFRFILTGKS